jgi:hypothetical protein
MAGELNPDSNADSNADSTGSSLSRVPSSAPCFNGQLIPNSQIQMLILLKNIPQNKRAPKN